MFRREKTRKRIALWLCAAFLCAPPAFAQRRAKPQPTPDAPDAPVTVTLAAFSGSDVRATNEAVTAEQQWWRAFNDPRLNTLIERAGRGNLDLQIAVARVREARAAHRLSEARRGPSLDTATTYNRLRGPVNPLGFIRPGAQSNLFQVGFDANWELDLFGGVKASVAAAQADAQAAEEARRDVLVTVLAEVARGYVQLRGAQRELAVTRQNLAIQQELAHLTRVRVEAGLATALDQERAEAQVETTRAALPWLESAATQAAHGLAVLLGKEPGALLEELAPAAPIPLAPTPNTGLPSELLRRRPDIRRAEAETAAAFARTKVAQAERFPKFNLGALFGRQGNSVNGFTLGLGNFFAFGPTVTLPIFNGGRIKANIAAQRARQEQAQRGYEETVLQALLEVENALTAQTHERGRFDALRKAAAANREAVKLAEELYALGQENFLAVLEAQRARFDTEAQLARSERDLALQLVALYKALGGGWAAVKAE